MLKKHLQNLQNSVSQAFLCWSSQIEEALPLIYHRTAGACFTLLYFPVSLAGCVFFNSGSKLT